MTASTFNYPSPPSVDRSQLPPGPPELPLLGQTWRFLRDAIRLMEEVATYGDLATLSVRPALTYQLNHPDLIQETYVSQHRRVGRGRTGRTLSLLLGNGLLVSEGAFHRRQRRLMLPHFHRQRIAAYADTMFEYTQRHQERWTDGMAVDMSEEMQDLTLHIVVKTLFDLDLPADVQRIGEALNFSNRYLILRHSMPLALSRLSHRLPMPMTLRFRRELAFLNQTIAGLIARRRQADQAGDDLLSLLLHTLDEEADDPEEQRMTDQQVRDETLTMFTAGHETTSLALTWTWYLLSLHPEWQTRWYAELDDVLGDRPVALDDLPRLTVTDQILTESMRLYPPVWSTGRMAYEPFELAGFPISAGTTLIGAPIVIHRDPRWYEEPLAFRPDRWTPEFRKSLPAFAYFPFGGGPRRCIGDSFAWMEAQIILVTLGQSWRMRCTLPGPVELKPLVTLYPKHGMPMVLERRRAG